jgi:hypothetical protein
MYKMTARVEVPITTLADGTALLTVCPQGAINPGFIVGFQYVPFATVSAGNTAAPFASSTQIYSPPGPFNSQVGNIEKFAVDALHLDFI